ncbi:MAG: hypothetical protein K9L62_10490 [Vallitaleaceae bacterium]|nr:hypothetical protein [Vallitaleaceae bacterium]
MFKKGDTPWNKGKKHPMHLTQICLGAAVKNVTIKKDIKMNVQQNSYQL